MATRSNSLKKSSSTEQPTGVIAKIASAPKGQIPVRSASLKKSVSSRFVEHSLTGNLEKLPPIKDVPPNLRVELLLRKIKQCCICFDFTDDRKDAQSKEVKREALIQCVEYIFSNREPLTEPIYAAVFTMVAINLFRPLPPHINPSGVMYDPEEDEPILEAAWSHIQIVYELFLRFIDAPDFNTQIAKNFLDQKFVVQLLDLFDSEDPRERDYLKTTLHRIYGKFLPLRGFIRTAIRDLFCTFIYETTHHNGVAELLEVLGSIINGFAVPLKEEHKQFLSRVLLPLHKPKNVSLFNSQLSYCVCQFVDKDPTVIDTIFRQLLRMWPVGNSPKEVLFINEIEELLNMIDDQLFKGVCVGVFKQIAKCFKAEHFQVAERALYLWSNDHIVSLVANNVELILPLVYGILHHNSHSHWNRTIRSLSAGSLQLFEEINKTFFAKVARQHFENQLAKNSVRMEKPVPTAVKQQEQKPPTPTSATNNTPSPSSSHSSSKTTETDVDVAAAMQAMPTPTPVSGVRRKSLLPIDASTLDALSKFKSLEDIVTPADDDQDFEDNYSDGSDDELEQEDEGYSSSSDMSDSEDAARFAAMQAARGRR
eukprot:TRINITY_DN4266_c0_g1_i2.p1 TRINITY_DN4266_c0_g1~~TRINITY_DN4266_c0_g1_i2.p1  ORF type:complete len:595 (+),score=161.26 TRINITY_DN4266_c0_g1_i2:335-2119(+)